MTFIFLILIFLVINEKALIRAMQSGKVSRVGLDVFEREPFVDPYFRNSERASLAPHWATHTTRTYRDIERELFGNLVSWLKTGRPNTAVNDPLPRRMTMMMTTTTTGAVTGATAAAVTVTTNGW